MRLLQRDPDDVHGAGGGRNNNGPVTNPQLHDLPDAQATDNTRVLDWFRSLMGLRGDGSKGLKWNDNFQAVVLEQR